MNKKQRLIRAKIEKIKTQKDYEELIDELAELRLDKVIGYGEDRYDKNNSISFDLWMCFSDIYRKHIRMKQLTERAVLTPTGARLKALRTNYMDLANYGIMGAQIMDKAIRSVAEGVSRINTILKENSKLEVTQIAIYSNNPKTLIENLSIFGINEWIEDTVEAEGTVFGKPASNTANLYFNYQIGNFELEILQYIKGDNWHRGRGVDTLSIPFLSHLGVHVDDVGWIKRLLKDFPIIQEVITKSHSNPAIAGKRSYHYIIFDTKKCFGFDFKVIKRIKDNE